jgi:telomerase reverse transcriptase
MAKRKRKTHTERTSVKRQRTGDNKQPSVVLLLQQYYHEVHSLRTYLVSRLPKSSKKRRRRLLRYGLQPAQDESILVDDGTAQLLDHIQVGISRHIEDREELEQLDEDISVFTQQMSETDILVSPHTRQLRQSEVGSTCHCLIACFHIIMPLQHSSRNRTDKLQIVDCAIWSLFRRHTGSYRPSHLLCHGFQRPAGGGNGVEARAVLGLPGIYATTDNPHVRQLKDNSWSSLPGLLGRGAERILIEMLTDCGVYQPVEDSSNMRQLSGLPLSELKAVVKEARAPTKDNTSQDPASNRTSKHRLSDIRFLRHRMLYARPSLKSSGEVRFGMTHAQVMSRYQNVDDRGETIHVMKYIFPRQFGLHNAFTSAVDLQDTSQLFKDYTLRESEIARERTKRKYRPGQPSLPTDRVPRRLRGPCFQLVERIRKRHSRCSFRALLDHYCPRPQPGTSKQTNTFDQATVLSNVSAFCQAVIRNVFPSDAFGASSCESDSFGIVMRAVHSFVCLRRYESFSLHDVMQGIGVTDIDWLMPHKTNRESNMSRSDFVTRKDILSELLYYMFDSYLIPLIRSHFHVTESGVHRNQLFYFRHDVWKNMSEPALTSLKLDMFEECSAAEIQGAMAQRALGISKVRLLPKEQGMRPIINLRRRVQRQEHGGVVLGRSINSILTPAFSILNYEKNRRPEILGSALFSVDDMFARLQDFRSTLGVRGLGTTPLYFAKVDVKSCFDTIPQKRLLKLAENILSANEYYLTRYARAKLLGGHNGEAPGFGAKPSWKFLTKATTDQTPFDLEKEITSEARAGRTRTAYVGGIVQRSQRRKAILDLLHEHVESNIVKLGNRLYRQKEGIPQGSIVSSLLCSYFYAELERNALGFVDKENSLLLRLIDDFLVITTDRDVAELFMHTMHAGLPEFGVQIKADKSRVNFDMEIDGSPVARLPAATDFPYCGNAINTITLDLSKDAERRKAVNVQDSVTVEYFKLPGQSFYRKTLNALKLHMRAMHLSTNYNSIETVLTNLHHAFNEVAHKSYSYIKSLPNSKQPSSKLIISKL